MAIHLAQAWDAIHEVDLHLIYQPSQALVPKLRLGGHYCHILVHPGHQGVPVVDNVGKPEIKTIRLIMIYRILPIRNPIAWTYSLRNDSAGCPFFANVVMNLYGDIRGIFSRAGCWYSSRKSKDKCLSKGDVIWTSVKLGSSSTLLAVSYS